MQKIVVMSDLHLTEAGGRVAGQDPVARFRAALDHAQAHHPDAVALFLLGDLADTGAPGEYARLRAVLADLPLPVHLMLGNHDRRAAFRAAFPDAPVTAEGFVQSQLDLAEHRLILLDTLDAGPDGAGLLGGRLCPARRDWLAQALQGRGKRLALVFTHHPAAPVGIPWLDDIRLDDGDALLAMLAPQDAQLVSGHVHRVASGRRLGVGWSTVGSTNHRNPLDLRRIAPSPPPDAPPDYAVLLLSGSGHVLHPVSAATPAHD